MRFKLKLLNEDIYMGDVIVFDLGRELNSQIYLTIEDYLLLSTIFEYDTLNNWQDQIDIIINNLFK